MLDKLSRNKFFSLLLLISLATSCWKKEIFFNTEILCPDGQKILVKFARLREMQNAIKAAYLEKKKLNTNYKFTIIRLPGNRSFKIEKIPPEDLAKCFLRESKMGVVDKDYINYFR